MSRTLPARAWVALAALVAWVVGGAWIAPSVIRQAYNQESLEILNGILSGRDANPVELYLDAWWSVFRWASLAVLVSSAAVVFPNGRRRLITWGVGGEPGLPAGTLVWYGAWLGMLGGLGEAIYHGVRQAVVHNPALGLHREMFWMGPLSALLAGVVVAGAMLALARLGATRWHAGKSTLLLGFGTVYSVMQSRGIALYPASEILLSVGLAALVARLVASRAEGLSRMVRSSRPYLVGLVLVAGAYGWYSLPSMAERRARASRAPAEAGRPNIVLLILDTVRAHNLSLHGYERPTTPELDAWASSGVVFERAVATAPWTLPTHATVFTGEYDFVARTDFQAPLDDALPTLAEILAERGYATAGFTANLMYTNDFSGLDRGFDRWEDYLPGIPLFIESSWLSQELLRPLGGLVGIERYRGAKSAQVVTDSFLRWLADPPDRPFFAFLNFFDAHSPYAVPEELHGTFGPSPSASWDAFAESWQSDPAAEYTPRQTEGWMNRYDEAILYMDRHLGLIRDALESDGLLDNTLVVVTADHGEMWGEHGVLGHASALYDELLHVPLVVLFPERVPAGARVSARASLRDLPATLLDLAGVTGPLLPGQALTQLWGDSSAGLALSPALAEADFDAANAPEWTPLSNGDMKSLYSGDLHYIRNGDGTEELYDLSTDPSESNDVSRAEHLQAAVLELGTRLDSLLTSWEALR